MRELVATVTLLFAQVDSVYFRSDVVLSRAMHGVSAHICCDVIIFVRVPVLF